MKLALLFLGAAFMMLSSCKTTGENTGSTAGTPQIKLSKSTCRGKCEAFDLSIFEDGTMVYKGIKNVDLMGEHHGKLDKADHKALLASFKAQKFSEMEDSYLTGARDLQTMEVTYGSKTCQYHKRLAPESLKTLVATIEGFINSASWAAPEQ